MRKAFPIAILGAVLWTVTPSAAPIGDERAVSSHIDQKHIDGGAIGAAELIEAGRIWFDAKFTILDGAGRPGSTMAIVPTATAPGLTPPFFRTAGPDSNGCSGCHNSPESGGAGDFVANAFVSEGFSDADFDTVDPQFSNERGTTHLFGSGLIELLAREMTGDLRAQRDAARRQASETGQPVTVELTSKGIGFGRLTVKPDGFMDVSELEGIDQDLAVRPFSQKGVFVSLRQFSVNALNAHHGMQASERFGMRFTGAEDFDGDEVADEAGPGDVTALVAFQAALPPPGQVMPQDAERREAVGQGEALFEQVGCAECHVPALPLDSVVFTEPNPYNPAGNLRVADVGEPLRIDLSHTAEEHGVVRDDAGRWLVPAFTDLKRHVIADDERPHFANELLSQRFVERDEFLTARLWGVGSSAPYGHRGDLGTLNEAIVNHGGEATESRRAYEALAELDRKRIVEFLLSLRIGGETPR